MPYFRGKTSPSINFRSISKSHIEVYHIDSHIGDIKKVYAGYQYITVKGLKSKVINSVDDIKTSLENHGRITQ